MRILIDGVVFQNNSQLGVQRLFRETLARIGAQHKVTIWTEFPALATLPENCVIAGPDFAAPIQPHHLFSQAKRKVLQKRRAKQKTSFDLYCSTYFTASPHRHLPEVVFVYDMIYEQFAFNIPGEGVIASKRERILNARRLVAISHATAHELAAFYPEVAERIRVVHLGADHLLASGGGVPEPAGIPNDPFVLFVGTRSGYKNFQTVLDAMTTTAWPQEVKLAVVGRPFRSGEELLVRRAGLANRVVQVGAIPDAPLAHWYRRSLGFVFPSLEEGFGFPSLEAQSCGAPVVCSDRPIFHEVCGDAALYFNPLDPAALANAVAQLTSSACRETLIVRGRENIRRFTWDQCARDTLAVLEEAAHPVAPAM